MIELQGGATKIGVRRAVGIVRVSDVNGREGERFVSPVEQETSIQRACAREEMQLVGLFHELDVSGFSTELDKRRGLSDAIGMIERGEADVIVCAYFDRFFRRLKVQEEVLDRVERAGGHLLALDFGEIRQDTAAQWLSGRMLGMVAEYWSRSTRDKTQAAKERAIANGIPTFDRIPPGYLRGKDRRLVVDEAKAEQVRTAFDMRASGSSLTQVYRWSQTVGLTRTFRATQDMLKNRIYLGELRFGKLLNTSSHAPIVDAAVFARVQGLRASPAPRGPASTRLLARQGLLVCGTCGARMVSGRQVESRPGRAKRTWFDYRCPPLGNCPSRASISADIVENAVLGFLQALQEGTYRSINDQVEEAEYALEATEQALASAVDAFDGMGDVAAVRNKLLQLRAEHDAAKERLESLQVTASGSAGLKIREWWDYSLEQQRALLRSLIKRIVVRRGGRGTERITIEPFEQPYAF